ncbi:maltose ABC transporter permease [Tepiditoga spiralis]|uniref:Maltose/maltodextrin transport system permease protein n=1 Tax=Tepiditoga spiralis TaxID=2108365 RepID=A0A7G1G3C0_9BACT|nr:ABC transporter permease subunit [Tepiditoga spiralis]BBE30495.1 maltose ABC transporter permease [Tepiditoga spiralis]
MKKFLKFLMWGGVAILNAILVWFTFMLFALGNYSLAVTLGVFVAIADWAIFSKKGYPYRYTIAALFFLFVLTIYPMYYTIQIAFTNYGTGHLFSRDQAIETLLTDTRFLYSPNNAEIYDFKIFVKYDEQYKPTEDFLVLLYNKEKSFLAKKPQNIQYDAKGNVKYAESELMPLKNDVFDETYKIIKNKEGKIIAIDNGKIKYTYFYGFDDPSVSSNSAYYNSVIRQKYLKVINLKNGKKSFRLSSDYVYRKFSESYRVYEAISKTNIIEGRKVTKTQILNTLTNTILEDKDGAFWDYDKNGVSTRLIGYVEGVGAYNFKKILTDPKIAGPFFKIFVWTFTYAILSVIFSFIIGLALALALNDKNMKGRMIYRTLLIIPWAIPVFISVLVWRNGFFNETYGIINKIFLAKLGLEPIKWLNDPFWAKISILIVNTWLGFPYMMTVTLGALQSIPGELYEASSIDGATKWKQFSKITMPLLMVSVAPLLVMSFAFNFNNFVGIYLLTGGGPALPNSNTSAGATDILISFTYKLAFEGRKGQDFGFASAIAIIIFGIVSIISYFNFKFSKAFEEVSR